MLIFELKKVIVKQVMSNDFLKIPFYIAQNMKEYEYLMNEYERMIDDFENNDYNTQTLIQFIEKFENFDSTIPDINEKRDEFLQNIANTIINRFNIDYNQHDNISLITSFNAINNDFNITKYTTLLDKIHDVRNTIFNILMKRGKRYILHSKAGYSFILSQNEKEFFKKFEVVIYTMINTQEKNTLINFLESKERHIKHNELNNQLIAHMDKN